ncbi:MAG: hypothetical protein GKR94_21840 [Gammaproteobacteria bacterium]|nr:hypothetical protein [Gammaproteobacteria bacterium]
MGAEVIKAEQLQVGDYGRFNLPNYASIGVYFNSVNRHKRSIAFDLQDGDSRAAVLQLIKGASKNALFRDCGVSVVLQSSGITYTLRLCARCFLALTKKLLFLEGALIPLHACGLVDMHRCASSELGADTRAVLADLGYGDGAIEALC